MLRRELLDIAGPVLDEVLAHPFWTGLAAGTLPPASLAAFVAQDTDHLLPAYARALLRTAAAVPDDTHAALLGRAGTASLEASDRLRRAYAELAPGLGLEPLDRFHAVDPATRAHCAVFTAASATSPSAGIGALLPMVWFNHRVATAVAAACPDGSRYARWIAAYQPGPGYEHAVEAFLAMADAHAAATTAAGRRVLVEHFTVAARREPLFADAAWTSAHRDPERTPA